MLNHSLTATSSLEQWLTYLETLHPTEIDLGLDRIKQVAKNLALQTPFVTITVAGTNGKGSTCTILDAILRAAGYKTGLYTSPHLVHYNERIQLNGELATDAQITQQFFRIEQARGEVSLSYFEFATLAALLMFEQEKVDVAILEVGLGGRLDAVNMVDADCSILTSVDIDHIAYLGDSREAVGWEKAHVFRPGRPAICADPLPPESVERYASEIGADLWLFGKDFNYSGDSQQWAYGGREQRRAGLAYPSLRGVNQLLNASAALAALEALNMKLVVSAQAVRSGLNRASIPGRLQILPGEPLVVLDVAHNPHAAGALAQNLDQMPCTGRTLAVLGMLNDKDAAGVLRLLIDRIDSWYVASLEGPRGLSSRDLAALLNGVKKMGAVQSNPQEVGASDGDRKPGVRPAAGKRVNYFETTVRECENPVKAFEQALTDAQPNDRILVFGSFATVGPVLKHLGRDPR
ncbi:bifunctional tetrahydrofolate synthase/dihydrofolate synthase [Alcaligenaceae bacterium 429]|uniref:bifunctional tetrahydrofolate synthase/dihydrofolate synthase n=1 Tax=Paenalcaligenes sp. Me52 TaxID=3392038 RepID=UPI001092C47E|nr:bifunctional tetrahydrofolate synthase/dihydrofolate synthase [Alcaligenaceae bacterium 429]